MQKYPTLKLLHDLGAAARIKHDKLYNKWVRIYDEMRILRGDEGIPNMGHLEANIDIILREAEAEQTGVFSEFGEYMGGGPLFLQLSLSRYWIMSNYELLRTTVGRSLCDSSSKSSSYCSTENCVRCSIKNVRDQFAEIRIPLAKFEPKGAGKLAEGSETLHADIDGPNLRIAYPGHGKYHGRILFEDETGSIGWSVTTGSGDQPVLRSRRDLSDLMLNLNLGVGSG